MLLQKRKTEFPVWGDVFGNILAKDWVHFPFDVKDQYGKFPAVNIIESETDYKIEMVAPGKTKEDFKISINENLLTISSEKEESKEEANEKYTRREFSYNSFTRSFRLSELADSEKIAAQYSDGILKITIPKKEIIKPEIKTISVS